MFICTANVVHTIPQALRDRMEVLQLAGYTEIEKVEIAKRFLVPKSVEGAGLTDKQHPFTRRGAPDRHPALHARGRASATSSARSRRSAARSRARWSSRATGFSEEITGDKVTPVPRRAALPARPWRRRRTRSASRPAWRGPRRRRDPGDRSDADARQGHADAHRQARRRDAGVGAGGHELRAVEGRGVRHRRRTSTARPTCTCTCPKAPSRRTGRRRASRWPRRWCRR